MKRMNLIPVLALFIALGTAHFNYAAATNYTPGNTVITWDLDDVLLEKPAKAGTIASIMARGAFRPSAWKAWYYAPKNIQTGGEWAEQFGKYDNKDIQELIMYLARGKKVIEGSLEIVKTLHDAGFIQTVATNMNCDDFEFFKKQPNSFLTENKYFSYTKCVAPEPNGARIKKTEPLYFKKYFAKCPKLCRKKYMIFIDDKQKNIDMAVKMAKRHGVIVIGIVFKNPAQLLSELVKLGILDITPRTASAVAQ